MTEERLSAVTKSDQESLGPVNCSEESDATMIGEATGDARVCLMLGLWGWKLRLRGKFNWGA
jgi:hypothetical protein